MSAYTLAIYGRPAPKNRARLGVGGGFYTPRSTRDYEDRIAWSCRADAIWFGEAPVAIEIELHARKKLRGDIDNYVKSVLDGLVKGGKIDDDRTVIRVDAFFVEAASEDKTIVRITRKAAA